MTYGKLKDLLLRQLKPPEKEMKKSKGVNENVSTSEKTFDK